MFALKTKDGFFLAEEYFIHDDEQYTLETFYLLASIDCILTSQEIEVCLYKTQSAAKTAVSTLPSYLNFNINDFQIIEFSLGSSKNIFQK